MDHYLTVVSEFARHLIGAVIKDADEIAAILASPIHCTKVVKTLIPVEAPAPETPADTAPSAPAETDGEKTDSAKG